MLIEEERILESFRSSIRYRPGSHHPIAKMKKKYSDIEKMKCGKFGNKFAAFQANCA